MQINTVFFSLVFLFKCLLNNKDYYAMFGVSWSISMEDLKKVFKQKLREFHPDKYEDEISKRNAQEKYQEFQEAYEILGDHQLRNVYDHQGFQGLQRFLEQRKQQKDFEQMQQANRDRQFGYQDEKAKDPLAHTNIPLITQNEIIWFKRRTTSWMIFFYWNTDQDILNAAQQIQNFHQKFQNIFEIKKINCDLNKNFCDEFFAYSTPELRVYSSISKQEPEIIDLEDLQEHSKDNQSVQYLYKIVDSTLQDYTHFLTQENLIQFEGLSKPKVVLVTKKNQTPALWKILSKEFWDQINFGVVMSKSGTLYEQLQENKKIRILGFNKAIQQHSELYTEININSIRQFIKDFLSNEIGNQSQFQVLELHDFYNRVFDCGKRDKMICVFIQRDFVNEKDVSQIKVRYLSDPIKLVVLKDFELVKNFAQENQIEQNEDIILAYKGKFSQFLIEQVQDKNNSKILIQNFIDKILSGFGTFKRAKISLEKLIEKINDKEL